MDNNQFIFERFMSIMLHGRKGMSTLVPEQLLQELSLEQFTLIRMVYRNGPIRASELADLLFVHRSAITVRVDKLVKKGLLERERDEGDRRNVYLRVSEKGMEFYRTLESKINEFVEAIIRDIPKEEMENFLNVFEKIATYIEKYEGEKQ
ncbi:MarR family transcriptional regulator [Siminovitchia fortis]|uniref:MarR family transcriptional regulator n=1 Tax=Siminovitchia fortis TaxID=254758 RepID=A0A443IZR9_9BACI|nr:MarR family transcriptional regulator [Siminovitchia fortis]RWR13656.1 MarR family transcriptional regulator [Siminovitchia fortis]WHY81880.1 MarR family transcriptional regulator [Siminovitchia fortis]